MSTRIKKKSKKIGIPQTMNASHPKQKKHQMNRLQGERGKLGSSALSSSISFVGGRFSNPLRLFSQSLLDLSWTRSSRSLLWSSSFAFLKHLTISLENIHSNCTNMLIRESLQNKRKNITTTRDASLMIIHRNTFTALTSVRVLLVKDRKSKEAAQLVPRVEKCFT